MIADNLFEKIPAHLAGELNEILVSSQHLRIERIVSHGHASPPDFWYDQEEHEWVLVVQGSARLQFDDGTEVSLNRGAHQLIPAYCRHRVTWTDPTEPTIWLAVFYQT